MFKLISLAVAAAIVVPAAASAASDARLSDVQFIQASRCGALSASTNLGSADPQAAQDYLKAQRAGRSEMAIDMAQKAWKKAAKEARNASDDRKAHLIAERDGACQAYFG